MPRPALSARFVPPGVVLMIVAACAEPAAVPARIDVSADTVVSNTTLVEPIDARVVDVKGSPVSQAAITFVGVPDSVVWVSQAGGAQCRTNGVARVVMTSGSLHAEKLIRCDIPKRLTGMHVVCMTLGDVPVPYAIGAYDADERPMPRARLRVVHSDTTIVQLKDGLLTPLKAGRASISASSGRHGSGTLITVRDSAKGARWPERSMCGDEADSRMRGN